MKIITCKNQNKSLFFFTNKLNNRSDFFIYSNCSENECDYLFFFDSRGISSQYEGSLVDLCLRKVGLRSKVILIARPLEITTWVTLYNFIQLNNIKAKHIITNMGFVDFTPKKAEILKMGVDQFSLYFPNLKISIKLVEKYLLTNGNVDDLFIQEYPKEFEIALVKLIVKSRVTIINTPIIKQGVRFERPRPMGFYTSILKGNEFNSKLKLNSTLLNFENFTKHETYDGVHFTNCGNKLIFQKLDNILCF